MFITLQYNVKHQTLQQLLNAICTTVVVPPACLFPIQNNAMKIKSCQKVCAAVPKEADCPTLYAFPAAVAVGPPSFLSTAETDRFLLLFRRRRRTYRNYGACLSLSFSVARRRTKTEEQNAERRQWPYFLALFPLSVSASSVLSSGLRDLWAYTPKSPIPSLLSLLPFKMKYCRRLRISERRQSPSLPLSTQNDKYAARSSSEKFPAATRLTD